MRYQIHTTQAVELAEFFNRPEYGLTANGRRMTAEGDRLIFSDSTLAYLREHCSDADDGYVSDDSSGLVIWVGGDGLMVETVPE